MELEILEISILYAVLAPAIVTALAVLVLPERMASLSIAIGFLSGYLGIQGWPKLIPKESTHWLVWIALTLAVLATLGLFEGKQWWKTTTTFVVSTLLTLYLIWLPAIYNVWTIPEAIGWFLTFLSGILLFWWSHSSGPDSYSPNTRWFIMLSVVAVSSLIVGISGSVIVSQLAAVVAATVAVLHSYSLWRPKTKVLRSSLPPIVILLAGIMATGWYFVEVPGNCLLLLVVSPLFARLCSGVLPSRWSKLMKSGVTLLCSALPVLLALYLAYSASPPLDFYY